MNAYRSAPACCVDMNTQPHLVVAAGVAAVAGHIGDEHHLVLKLVEADILACMQCDICSTTQLPCRAVDQVGCRAHQAGDGAWMLCCHIIVCGTCSRHTESSPWRGMSREWHLPSRVFALSWWKFAITRTFLTRSMCTGRKVLNAWRGAAATERCATSDMVCGMICAFQQAYFQTRKCCGVHAIQTRYRSVCLESQMRQCFSATSAGVSRSSNHWWPITFAAQHNRSASSNRTLCVTRAP